MLYYDIQLVATGASHLHVFIKTDIWLPGRRYTENFPSHAVCSTIFYYTVIVAHLDFVAGSDTLHVAYTVQGDCMELHVPS